MAWHPFWKIASPAAAMAVALLDAHLNYKRKKTYEKLDELQRKFNFKIRPQHLYACKKLDSLILGILNQDQGVLKLEKIVDTMWAAHQQKTSQLGEASSSSSSVVTGSINPDENGGDDGDHDHHGD